MLVLLTNFILQLVNLIVEFLLDFFLLFQLGILVVNLVVQLLNLAVNVRHFVLGQLQFGFRLEAHVSDLFQILSVHQANFLQLIQLILFDLFNGGIVSFDELVVGILLLVNLRLLKLHLFTMVVLEFRNFGLVLLS